MEETYIFGEKVMRLRKEKGYSQEQLADLAGVSRQAVSKWEAGQSMPALEKMILLSDIFGVSIDYLVRDNALDESRNKTVITTTDDTAVLNQLDEIKKMVGYRKGYEYKSKKMVCGLPLVHVNFSKNDKQSMAVGIVAIGNVAVGVISIGGVSIGILSFGIVALGLLSLGVVSIGGIAFGLSVIGGIAIGGVTLGIYSFGGISVGKELAVGGLACGKVAIGSVTDGEKILNLNEMPIGEIRACVHQLYPQMPNWLLNIVLKIIES